MTTISDEPQKCESGCELSVVYTDDDGANMCVDCLIATVRDNATNPRVVTEAEVEVAARALASHASGGVCRPDDPDIEWRGWAKDVEVALTALGFEVQG